MRTDNRERVMRSMAAFTLAQRDHTGLTEPRVRHLGMAIGAHHAPLTMQLVIDHIDPIRYVPSVALQTHDILDPKAGIDGHLIITRYVKQQLPKRTDLLVHEALKPGLRVTLEAIRVGGVG